MAKKKETVVKELKVPPTNRAERVKLDLRSGDTLRVWQKIREKDKFRLQAFEGLVLAHKHGKEAGATFTVRTVIDGVGVERIFPLYSPMIDNIEIVKRSKVRRAKLYHIPHKTPKTPPSQALSHPRQSGQRNQARNERSQSDERAGRSRRRNSSRSRNKDRRNKIIPAPGGDYFV